MAARLICLFFLIGCSSGFEKPVPDHLLYSQATAKGSATAEERLALCSQMTDELARGDCGSVVVLNAARKKHPAPETLCPLVQEGTWRYECIFQVAEHWRRRKRMDRAVELCKQTGPFVRDCGQHMWQSELRSLAISDAALVDLVREGKALFAKWEPFFKSEKKARTDFYHRFWRHFYQHYVQPGFKVNLEICVTLDGAQRLNCRRSLGALYLRKVQQVIRHPDEMEAFCEVREDQLHTIFDGALNPQPFRASPDPLLVEVLRRTYDHVCVKKEPLPVRSNWLLEDQEVWIDE